MKIAIGNDHTALEMKEAVKVHLEEKGYEVLDLVVNKDGVEYLDFDNRYVEWEVKTENLNLLSFDVIMKIYEKMMLVQNADILNYEQERTYHINRITFGYTRIYEPASDSRTGILVPDRSGKAQRAEG